MEDDMIINMLCLIQVLYQFMNFNFHGKILEHFMQQMCYINLLESKSLVDTFPFPPFRQYVCIKSQEDIFKIFADVG